MNFIGNKQKQIRTFGEKLKAGAQMGLKVGREAGRQIQTGVSVALRSSKFSVGFDLESYSAVDLSKTYQGLNTSTDDIFANFRFDAQRNATNIRIDAYALYDQLIVCQNGSVVGVSF
jgi:hypothetical protein